MKHSLRNSAEKGFSLIEIMVALVIGSVVITGTFILFLSAKGSMKTNEMLAQVQENGRISLEWIAHDLRMAGHRGLTYTLAPLVLSTALPPDIDDDGSIKNCFTTTGPPAMAMDWALALLPTRNGEMTPAVIGEDNLAASGSTVFSDCIADADVQAGSDIISMHYFEATPVAAASLQAGEIYVSSGMGGAVLFQCPSATSGTACRNLVTDRRADTSGNAYFSLVSRAYYVRNWSVNSGDGIPTLVRVELRNDGIVETVPLVDGISSLQVRYGVDSNNDGFVDQFKTADDMPALNSTSGLTTDWNKIKSVKVDVLAQSVDDDRSRGNGDKSHTFAGETITVPDEYISRVFSTTITTRNVRSQ